MEDVHLVDGDVYQDASASKTALELVLPLAWRCVGLVGEVISLDPVELFLLQYFGEVVLQVQSAVGRLADDVLVVARDEGVPQDDVLAGSLCIHDTHVEVNEIIVALRLEGRYIYLCVVGGDN